MREEEKDNYFLVKTQSGKNELPKEQKRRGAKAPLVKPKPSPFNHRTSKKVRISVIQFFHGLD